MIENSKKYLITVETTETVIVQSRWTRTNHGFCDKCRTLTELLTPDELLALTQHNEQIVGGYIHRVLDDEASLPVD